MKYVVAQTSLYKRELKRAVRRGAPTFLALLAGVIEQTPSGCTVKNCEGVSLKKEKTMSEHTGSGWRVV